MASRFVVSEGEAGTRLDRLVARHVPGVGRRTARELFDAGRVTLDGRRVRPAAAALAGAIVEVDFEGEGATPDPAVPLDVRLELPTHVVVYKPSGVPSAPLRAGELGTLANALVARYPEMAELGHRAREPGLVHRLDTETSGLLVAARSEAAFAILRGALTSGKLVKRYLAITSARSLPEQGVIERALSPDTERRGRVLAREGGGQGYARPAVTRYRVIRRTPRHALVELEAGRAFRHQIRAHLASVGAPLVGDTLYGGEPWPSGSARHALHASHIAWAGDATLPSFLVTAELPDDLLELLGD
ncbi:MAG TPA: RluA family pseudouridine synthase [Polyangiaceae bacterium]